MRFRLMQKKNHRRDARIASYRAGGRVIDAANAPINSELKWSIPTDPKRKFSNRRLRKIRQNTIGNRATGGGWCHCYASYRFSNFAKISIENRQNP
jgi:hypothetical protein